jgi:hypothetical protein
MRSVPSGGGVFRIRQITCYPTQTRLSALMVESAFRCTWREANPRCAPSYYCATGVLRCDINTPRNKAVLARSRCENQSETPCGCSSIIMIMADDR